MPVVEKDEGQSMNDTNANPGTWQHPYYSYGYWPYSGNPQPQYPQPQYPQTYPMNSYGNYPQYPGYYGTGSYPLTNGTYENPSNYQGTFGETGVGSEGMSSSSPDAQDATLTLTTAEPQGNQ